MRVLLAPTEDFIKRERTKTTDDTLAGAHVSVPVQNSAGYTSGDYVVIGYEGSEQAELVQIESVSGQNLVLDLLKLPHTSDEPVIKYRYNKRKFYGALTATGSFAEITGSGSPVVIAVNDPQGTIIEYTGVEGYQYFKATYFNSTTADETDAEDSQAVLADESVRYCSIYAIKKQAGLTNNPFITDGIVEGYRTQAENEIDSYLNSRYVVPYTNSSGTAEIPALLTRLCYLLAAGYMDYQEFGAEGEGVKWLGEARAILKNLQGPGGLSLLGSDHVEMTTKTNAASVTSYPDQVDNTNGPDQKFTMRQVF